MLLLAPVVSTGLVVLFWPEHSHPAHVLPSLLPLTSLPTARCTVDLFPPPSVLKTVLSVMVKLALIPPLVPRHVPPQLTTVSSLCATWLLILPPTPLDADCVTRITREVQLPLPVRCTESLVTLLA